MTSVPLRSATDSAQLVDEPCRGRPVSGVFASSVTQWNGGGRTAMMASAMAS